MQFVETVALGVLAISLAGCASIVDGGPRKVSVNSDPSDAKVTVFNKKGEEVFVQQTPAMFKLKRGAGYFKGASYHLVIEKEGFQKSEVDLKSTVNGWYIANIFIGGIIGFLIVDPATGAMYTLSPKDVNVVLEKQSASIQQEDGSFLVMLRENVPAELIPRLIPATRQ